MLFCVTVKLTGKMPIKARMRWTVEAEDEGQAISNLLGASLPRSWSGNSYWSLTILCDDCPYRSGVHDSRWPYQPIHCRGGRALLASGKFHA